MKRIIFIFLIFSNFVLANNNEIFDHQREFSARITETAIKGDMNVTGASIMCVNNGSGSCDWTYNGYLYNASGLFLQDDPSITKNSSGAYLEIPEGASIVWAGLYWQGHKWNQESGLNESNFNAFKQNIDKVVFETPDGVKHNITADQTDYYGFLDNTRGEYQGERIFYSCFKDVTDLVRNYQGRQYFVVGDMDVSDGNDQWIGDPLENWSEIIYGPWGGWSLVVIYQYSDSDEYNNIPYKNIAIFDGFKKLIPAFSTNNQLNEECIEIPDLTGFLTPRFGNVDSNMLFFATGGEKKMDYDSLQLKDKDDVYQDVNNSLNPVDDQFNDSITILDNDINSTRIYNPGIDIDYFNVGDDNISNDIIGNSQTSTAMKLCAKANSSQGDQAFPSVIAFSTQLYTPNICYDNLKFYDANGNEIPSGSKVNIGAQIRAEIIIKNESNETARDLNISLGFENNLTSYIENSTRIKDVTENDYVSINDNENIGSLGVIYNDVSKYWQVGILGDNNNEFLPTDQNSSYVAYVDFNFTVENEGNISFDFNESYMYIYDNQPFYVHKKMDPCAELNANLNTYSNIYGSFNVVNDDFEYPDDSPLPTDNTGANALHTQIVNNLFYLKLVKLADDNVTVEPFDGIVKVELINSEDNTTISAPVYVSLSSSGTNSQGNSDANLIYGEFNDTSPIAVKQATYKIVYLKRPDGSLVTNRNNNCINNTPDYNCIWGMLEQLATDRYGNACPTGANNGQYCDVNCSVLCNYKQNRANDSSFVSGNCLRCVFGDYSTGTVYAKDKFAIRPDHFQIASVSNAIKAGEFNLTLKAADPSGNPVTDYNETLTVEGNSPTFEYNDTKASQGCNRGMLNIITNAQFSNGEANVTLKYTEVGDLNLTLKEVNGSEFAIVDQNDTNNTARLITENSQILYFIPDHFAVSGTYNNPANGTFTYISSDLNMSAELNLTVRAENENNNTTQNYNNICYAKNFDLNVSYNDLNTSKVPNILYYKVNSTQYSTATNNDLNFTNLSKDFFGTDNNGTANFVVKINFDKNYTNPIDEFNMTVRDVNVSDVNGTFGTHDIDDNATFRYGRIKVSNAAAYSSDINTTFEYQYWSNDGWVKNTDHNLSVLGDVNITKSYYPTSKITFTKQAVNGGEEKVKFSLNTSAQARPFSTKIHLSVGSWLWYHPLAKDYKDPSATNTDCLTHPCMKLDFLKSGSAWGGVQAVNNSAYTEENRTSEMNVSAPDVNVSKSQVKKINW